MKKSHKIIYWIATIWLALGMISTGSVQLLGVESDSPGGSNSLMKLGYPLYLMTMLGVGKLLGVIAVLVPKFPTVKEWAYAGFFFMMLGAIYSHLAANDPIVEIFPALLLLILTATSWYFRPADRKLTFNQ